MRFFETDSRDEENALLKPEKRVSSWRFSLFVLVSLVVIGSVGFATRKQVQQNNKMALVSAQNDGLAYYVTPGKGTYAQARAVCVATGGKIASIHSKAQNAQVKAACNAPACWIGLNDIKKQGHWVWPDGSALNYVNWARGEPNKGNGRQTCTSIYKTNGLWNDLGCDGRHGTYAAVCEKKKTKYSLLRTYKCPPGTREIARNAKGCVCKTCPAGFSCRGGSAKPKKCKVGTYQAHVGQIFCQPASAGNFVKMTGSKSQSPCSRGTYQDKRGQRWCKKAPKGHYVPKAGGRKAIPCNYGTYQARAGQAYCVKSPRGQHVPRRGRSKPIKCGKNSFQDCRGQRSCIPCPIGQQQPMRGQTKCV